MASVAFNVPLLNIAGEVTRHVRLFGVNCPEIRTPEGKAAKAFVEAAAASARKVEVEAVKASDDFGRLLGRVYLDGIDLGQMLVSDGYAVVFRGVAAPGD